MCNQTGTLLDVGALIGLGSVASLVGVSLVVVGVI